MDNLGKRTIKVTIQKLNKNNEIEYEKVFDNLNTKFAFTKYIGASMYGIGSVSICGLDRFSLDKLISFASEKVVLEEEKKRIKIEAGYENTKQALIIDGSIMSAIPSAPPDIWLKCEVVNGYELQKKYITLTIEEGLTLEEYAKLIAKTLGLDLKIRIKNTNYLNKKMGDCPFQGTEYQLISTISQAFGIVKDEDSCGKIVAYADNGTLIVDYYDLDKKDERLNDPILISKETGMVGLPEMSLAGTFANITTILKPEIYVGDVIKLESGQLKSANGLYYVQGITYTGEFRGNSWYTTLSCWRIS